MRMFLGLFLGVLLGVPACGADLPAQYFKVLGAGMAQVSERLAAEPASDLQALEARPGWRHFPSAVLVAAVLYAKRHPANPHFGDAKMLAAAEAIGDLTAAAQEKGVYSKRLDHHRDTYMWVEAYRLLEPKLSEERKARWRRALSENLVPLAADIAKRQNFPYYTGPYLGTSPNHYSLWSSTLYLAGQVFSNKEWEDLGGRVMHRFAAEEQAPDGYWGEQTREGPTTGYDYLTETAVALYWERSRDKAALEALRRSTDFHKYFTYPDGTPVETVNDRNRYWSETMWGHFGFSNFADGRRYSEFLMDFYDASRLSLEALGRLAQNALYYHEGRTAPIPQDLPQYVHRMSVPAAMRKSGPWVVCLSGLMATPSTSQFRLERQGHMSIFHEKLGLIVTGANSKRQPELATFSETASGQVFFMPMSTRLDMGEQSDRLALAFNSFFSVLEVPRPSGNQLDFRFAISPKGRIADAVLTLQLCLKPGRELETAAGKKVVLSAESLELEPADIGGWIRHNGWTLKTPAAARLVWPVRPFNPYANAPETGIQHAVGALATRLEREPATIAFSVAAN